MNRKRKITAAFRFCGISTYLSSTFPGVSVDVAVTRISQMWLCKIWRIPTGSVVVLRTIRNNREPVCKSDHCNQTTRRTSFSSAIKGHRMAHELDCFVDGLALFLSGMRKCNSSEKNWLRLEIAFILNLFQLFLCQLLQCSFVILPVD